MDLKEPRMFAGILTGASEILYLSVVVWIFWGDSLLMGVGILTLIVSTPIVYISLKRTMEAEQQSN